MMRESDENGKWVGRIRSWDGRKEGRKEISLILFLQFCHYKFQMHASISWLLLSLSLFADGYLKKNPLPKLKGREKVSRVYRIKKASTFCL